MLFLVITVVIALAVTFYTFLISNFNYWKKRGVNGPKPMAFLGNYPNMFSQKRHMTYDLQSIYESYKKSDDFVGIFSVRSPQLLITNCELVRRIYTTDFKHFHDNEASLMVDEKSDFIFANNPFSLTGETWRERRAEVTPGFTSSRIKTIFPITTAVCDRMMAFINEQMKMGPKDGIDCLNLSLRFTSEAVTDCVLGLQANSFTDKPIPIVDKISKLFQQSFFLTVSAVATALWPSLRKIWKLRFIAKPTEDFFVNLMQDTLNMRRSGKLERADFMNYIMQLQEKKNLSTLEVTAHTMTFLFDGYETTASVLSHVLLFLSRDLKRQQKLRDEILQKLGKNNDFETVMDLPYLDACIHEAIRILPPGFFSNKLCTEPIELTNKNGQRLQVTEGTVVVLPLHAIMNDPDHYEDPDSFEPERFLEENGGIKKYQNMGVYYGFAEGPRMCLGMRFALSQLKGALVNIIRNYEIRVTEKTRKDNVMDPKYFLSRLDGGVWVNFQKIE